MVYVVANDGQPLMPTERHGKVCRMLRSGMAKVIKKCPFTIQLQYESERNVQPVSLGVDARSKHIGISATTKTKVLYESDVELRDDIVKLLATRRQLRRSRRSRKTRSTNSATQSNKRPQLYEVVAIIGELQGYEDYFLSNCLINNKEYLIYFYPQYITNALQEAIRLKKATNIYVYKKEKNILFYKLAASKK